MSIVFFFQKRKISPTKRDEIMWLINKTLPSFTSPKRDTPTEPNIKIGPELLVNAISRSASALEQILWSYKLHTNFAQTG